MVVESGQAFTVTYPGPPAAALAFVRSPGRTLSHVAFLRDVAADHAAVRGELLVQLPVLGTVDLPFESRVELRPDGAALVGQDLAGERAWVEVHGTARVHDDPPGSADGVAVSFSFVFRAHLSLPDGGGWGGDAFAKMVQAAATRTLARVARELPDGIAAAMAAPGP